MTLAQILRFLGAGQAVFSFLEALGASCMRNKKKTTIQGDVSVTADESMRHVDDGDRSRVPSTPNSSPI